MKNPRHKRLQTGFVGHAGIGPGTGHLNTAMFRRANGSSVLSTVAKAELFGQIGAVTETLTSADAVSGGFLVSVVETAGVQTNFMTNPGGYGTVLGSTTAPTDWSLSGGGTITRQVAGYGTDGGIPYIDFLISGTPSSTGSIQLIFEPVSTVAAADGEIFTFTAYASMPQGDLTNVSQALIRIADSVTQSSTSIATITNAALNTQQWTRQRTTAVGGAYVRPQFLFSVTSGLAINFTLRVGIGAKNLLLTKNADIGNVQHYQDTSAVFSSSSVSETGSSSDAVSAAASTFVGAVTESGSSTDTTNGTVSYAPVSVVETAGVQTNFMTNPGAAGTVVGSSTMPTDWGILNTTGLSVTVSGYGTDSGIPYIEFLFNGTPSTSQTIQIQMAPTGAILVNTSEIWTASVYTSLPTGTTAGISAFSLRLADLNNQAITSYTPTNAALNTQNVSRQRTMIAGATWIRPILLFTTISGTPTNFTFRVGVGPKNLLLVKSGEQSTNDYPDTSASVFVGAITESGSATDTVNFAASTFVGAVSESGSATDTTDRANTVNGAVTESGTASDTTNVLATFAGTVSESGTVADSVSGAMIFGTASAVTETIGVPTNFMTNPGAAGAILGTGNLPNDWVISNLVGIPVTIAGYGIDGGIPYIDISYVGTPNASSTIALYLEPTNTVLANNGDVWNYSAFVSMPSGSLTNVSNAQFRLTDANGNTNTSLLSITNAALNTQQWVRNRTIASGGTWVRPAFVFTFTNGAAVNFTIRIGTGAKNLLLTLTGEQSVNDYPDTSASVFVGAISETGSASDSVNFAASTFVGAVSESGSSIDSSNGANNTSGSISETGSTTDNTNTTASTFNGNVSENITALDSTNAVSSTFVGAIAENANATTAQSTSASFSGIVSENVTTTDATNTTISTYVGSVSESENVQDDGNAYTSGENAVNEAENASDTTNSTAVYTSDVSESITVSDSADAGGTVLNVSVSESLTTTDSVSAIVSYAASISESVSGSDSTNTTISTFVGNVSETVTSADDADTFTGSQSSVSENESTNDFANSSAIFNASVSETLSSNDIVDATGSIFNASISEIIALSDSVDASRVVSGNVDENGNAIDQTDSATTQNNVVEVGNLSDIVDAILIYGARVDETLTVVDDPDAFRITNGNVDETGDAEDQTDVRTSEIITADVIESLLVIDHTNFVSQIIPNYGAGYGGGVSRPKNRIPQQHQKRVVRLSFSIAGVGHDVNYYVEEYRNRDEISIEIYFDDEPTSPPEPTPPQLRERPEVVVKISSNTIKHMLESRPVVKFIGVEMVSQTIEEEMLKISKRKQLNKIPSAGSSRR